MSKESMELALQTAEGIANANWREWHELASPDEFERWVKSRANHMAIALREALAEQPAHQELKIDMYRSFEQWKSGNVLEHGVPRTEYYNEAQLDLVEMGWNYGYDAGRAVEQALDKKAENARELGLDYEPEQPQFVLNGIDCSCGRKWRVTNNTLTASEPAQPAQQEPVQRYSPDGEGGMEIDSLGAWVKFTSPQPAQQEPVLQDIEQYRLQMAGICTAAIGYWKEGDGIHPDYDTVALRDVAKLYAKYDELYKAQDVSHAMISGALFDFMGWLTSRPKRIMLSSADDASPAVDAIKDFAKMRGLSLDEARVQDWQDNIKENT